MTVNYKSVLVRSVDYEGCREMIERRVDCDGIKFDFADYFKFKISEAWPKSGRILETFAGALLLYDLRG